MKKIFSEHEDDKLDNEEKEKVQKEKEQQD